MIQGLFASLLIGTIISTLGQLYIVMDHAAEAVLGTKMGEPLFRGMRVNLMNGSDNPNPKDGHGHVVIGDDGYCLPSR